MLDHRPHALNTPFIPILRDVYQFHILGLDDLLGAGENGLQKAEPSAPESRQPVAH